MKTQNKLMLLLAALTIVTGVKAGKPDSVIYRRAIVRAMSPDPSKINSNLIPVTPQNKNLTWKTINGEDYVLVVTWSQSPQYYQPYLDSSFYNTGKYEIWITTSPELLNRFKASRSRDTNRRLQQMLGLPPNSQYKYFIEFWVRAQDLFRPCADNEVTDSSCGLCFPEGTDSTYKVWMDNGRISRYYPCHLYNKYPWTQLGYTFDWNPKNKTHVGCSEFVIRKFSKVVVNGVYTTSQYLNQQEGMKRKEM